MYLYLIHIFEVRLLSLLHHPFSLFMSTAAPSIFIIHVSRRA
jgi:hypothetical protein